MTDLCFVLFCGVYFSQQCLFEDAIYEVNLGARFSVFWAREELAGVSEYLFGTRFLVFFRCFYAKLWAKIILRWTFFSDSRFFLGFSRRFLGLRHFFFSRSVRNLYIGIRANFTFFWPRDLHLFFNPYFCLGIRVINILGIFLYLGFRGFSLQKFFFVPRNLCLDFFLSSGCVVSNFVPSIYVRHLHFLCLEKREAWPL